jgi:hypothetical protein
MTGKDEGRRMKDERKTRRVSRAFGLLLFSSFILHPSSFTLATPTQDEVLKSISNNVGESVDPGKLLAAVFGVAAFVILIALVSQRRKRIITPKPLNHPGKLLKEVSRSVSLKPAEVKQLKLLAEAQDSSPLLLLLCPSMLGKAVKSGGVKVDRQVLNSIARKMNVKT